MLTTRSWARYVHGGEARAHIMQGSRTLGKMLREGSSLTRLNLRLNCMGDDGGTALLEGLSRCSSLVDLNLSANDLSSRSAVAISQLLSSAEAKLTYLDISSNSFRGADVMRIDRAMESNNVSKSGMLPPVVHVSMSGPHEHGYSYNEWVVRRLRKC